MESSKKSSRSTTQPTDTIDTLAEKYASSFKITKLPDESKGIWIRVDSLEPLVSYSAGIARVEYSIALMPGTYIAGNVTCSRKVKIKDKEGKPIRGVIYEQGKGITDVIDSGRTYSFSSLSDYSKEIIAKWLGHADRKVLCIIPELKSMLM